MQTPAEKKVNRNSEVKTISRQKSRQIVEKKLVVYTSRKKKFTKHRQKKADELLRQTKCRKKRQDSRHSSI